MRTARKAGIKTDGDGGETRRAYGDGKSRGGRQTSEVLTVKTAMGTPMRAQMRAEGTNSFESVIHPKSFKIVFRTDIGKGTFRMDTVEGVTYP